MFNDQEGEDEDWTEYEPYIRTPEGWVEVYRGMQRIQRSGAFRYKIAIIIRI